MPVKKCSKCGTSFQCGCDASACWCECSFVEKEVLEKLKKEFENCLCSVCLEQYSVKSEKNNFYP